MKFQRKAGGKFNKMLARCAKQSIYVLPMVLKPNKNTASFVFYNNNS